MVRDLRSWLKCAREWLAGPANRAGRSSGPAPHEGGAARGSALIMTLGVLLLVSVLFMSFTIVAIYNQQNVKHTEETVRARMMCESGLQQAYGAMCAEWGEVTDGYNVFPASKPNPASTTATTAWCYVPTSGSWSGRRYWASSQDTTVVTGTDTQLNSAFNLKIAGVDFTPQASVPLPDAAAYYSGGTRPAIGWKYVYGFPSAAGNDTPIIGRVAYLVIDESGKFDPTAAVAANYAEGDLPPDAATREDVRATDINLKHAFDDDNLAAYCQPVGTGTGKMPATYQWESYFQIFKTFGTLSAAQQSEIVQGVVFPHGDDFETFFDGGSTTEANRHRCDLSGVPWDAFANTIESGAGATFFSDSTPYNFFAVDGSINNSSVHDTRCIPYLSNCQLDIAIKKQVWANFVDYMDADSVPTTDYNGSNIPTYVGLEKVPYINEIVVSARLVAVVSPAPPPPAPAPGAAAPAPGAAAPAPAAAAPAPAAAAPAASLAGATRPAAPGPATAAAVAGPAASANAGDVKDLPGAPLNKGSKYDLTLVKGTPAFTKNVNEGATVSIAADPPSAGEVFKEWTGDTVHVASPTSASTTVAMPNHNLTLTATYKPKPTYTLTVNSGSGSGSYTESTVVTIVANAPPAGMVFDQWTGATVANATASTTTLTMPAADTTVTATYKAGTNYTLTVVSGSGGGSYASGAVVSITANAPPAGMVFDQWTGATVAAPTSATTTLTMPGANTTVTATYKASGGGGGSTTYNLELTVYVELVNMYADAFSQNGDLTVNLYVQSTEWNNGGAVIPFTLSSSAIAGQNYAQVSATSTFSVGTNTRLRNFQVRVDRAVLKKAGTSQLWDWAGKDTTALLWCPGTTTVDVSALKSVAYEVNDPRCNLDATYWTWSAAWASGSVTGTLGSNNSSSAYNPNPGGDRDPETGATSPWNVSTAYIRNGAPKTLWELGAIHRGEPWRTINLGKFADYVLGMGIYSAGDANILDQVKLGPGERATGRVNVDTYNKKVVKGLLTGTMIGATYTRPWSGGTVITDGAATTIANGTTTSDWLYRNGALASAASDSSVMPFVNRGELARITTLTNGTCGVAQTTDRKREEIVGKLAGLATVRTTYYTLLVDSQVIQDLPNGMLGSTRGRYDAGKDKIRAEQKIMATVKRDAFTNTFRLLRFDYVDE